jgi:hypothetical protein
MVGMRIQSQMYKKAKSHGVLPWLLRNIKVKNINPQTF